MSASLAHRLELWAFRALVSGLRALPFRRAVALGARVGALGYRPLGIRRRIVERHIAAAFPGLDRKGVRRLARASYEHIGRMGAEAVVLATRGREGVLAQFEGVDGFEHLERAIAAGRGLVIVTGHLGNWELCAGYMAARGVPLDVVVREMSNPLFDAYLNDTRLRLGMRVVYDREAVRQSMRAFQAGRAVGFVSDQGVKGLASTFVPFFGRPAKTPRGAAVFALRWSLPVVFVTALRQPGGKFRFIAEPVPVEDTGDRERDVDRVVMRFTETLERYARLAPEQYFWHHRRWRRQPPDTPPELRDPAAE
jgi:KDO2-lipid IV(A) lauroyltransferase